MGKIIKNGRVYAGGLVVDSALDVASENPIQNKVVAGSINQINSDLSALNQNLTGYQIRLTSENLDDVVTPGKYFQGSSVNCTVARKYPVATAGYLEVEAMSDNAIIQTYHPSASSHYPVSFQRRRYNGTWESWNSSDWVTFVGLPTNITIPTTGYSIALDYRVYSRCRAKRILTFNVNELAQRGFGASGYAQFNFYESNTAALTLRWENVSSSPTACKLYYEINGTRTELATGNRGPKIQGMLGNMYVNYQLSQ